MPRADRNRVGTDRPVVNPAHCDADPPAKAEIGLAPSQRRHTSSRPRTAGRRRGTGTWQVHSTPAQDCFATQWACPGAAGRHPCRRRAGSRDRSHSGGRVHDGEEGKVIHYNVRRAAISALALTGAAVIGGTVIPRAASASSLPAIGQVKCQITTFNVLYGADREACYEGTGEITTRVGPVFTIQHRGEHRILRADSRHVEQNRQFGSRDENRLLPSRSVGVRADRHYPYLARDARVAHRGR